MSFWELLKYQFQKKGVKIALIIMLVVIISLTAVGVFFSAKNKQTDSSPTNDNMTSQQLIDKDLSDKKIDINEAVKQKLYADFDRTKLDNRYKGNTSGLPTDSDAFIFIATHYDELNAETKKFVAEFEKKLRPEVNVDGGIEIDENGEVINNFTSDQKINMFNANQNLTAAAVSAPDLAVLDKFLLSGSCLYFYSSKAETLDSVKNIAAQCNNSYNQYVRWGMTKPKTIGDGLNTYLGKWPQLKSKFPGLTTLFMNPAKVADTEALGYCFWADPKSAGNGMGITPYIILYSKHKNPTLTDTSAHETYHAFQYQQKQENKFTFGSTSTEPYAQWAEAATTPASGYKNASWLDEYKRVMYLDAKKIFADSYFRYSAFQLVKSFEIEKGTAETLSAPMGNQGFIDGAISKLGTNFGSFWHKTALRIVRDEGFGANFSSGCNAWSQFEVQDTYQFTEVVNKLQLHGSAQVFASPMSVGIINYRKGGSDEFLAGKPKIALVQNKGSVPITASLIKTKYARMPAASACVDKGALSTTATIPAGGSVVLGDFSDLTIPDDGYIVFTNSSTSSGTFVQLKTDVTAADDATPTIFSGVTPNGTPGGLSPTPPVSGTPGTITLPDNCPVIADPDGVRRYHQGLLKGIPCEKPISDLNQTLTVVKNLISDYLLPVVGVIFSIMFLVGSILYISSNGDTSRVDKAKKTLLFAIGGLLLVLLAEIAIGLLVKLLGGNIS